MLDRLLGFSAAGAVIAYRRTLSPVKGFRCPHHLVHGAGSCSDFGLDAFRAFGFREGYRRLRKRVLECKDAARTLMMTAADAASGDDDAAEKQKKKKKEKWYERWCGDCGLGLPSCGGRRSRGDADGSACDLPDCDFIPDCSW